jgi:hypothetical protein
VHQDIEQSLDRRGQHLLYCTSSFFFQLFSQSSVIWLIYPDFSLPKCYKFSLVMW